MKICILGPVTTECFYGGVAVFDDALGAAFEECGHEVLHCSKQSKKDVCLNIPFRHISVWNINKILNEEKPDIIISSLDYAKYYPIIQYKCHRVHFIHGFFTNAQYGVIKGTLCRMYQRIFVEKCDRIYANSQFTEVVNHDILGLKISKTLPLGVSEKFFLMAKEKNNTQSISKKIIFAGRLAKSKQIDTIIRAVKRLHDMGFEFEMEIIGDGPEKDRLIELSRPDKNISFYGRLTQEQLFKKERYADIFISLCPYESYGMAYYEALLAQCIIVCPHTGGQIEFLEPYKENVIKVNPMDINSVIMGIHDAMLRHFSPIDEAQFKKDFSYASTAESIVADMQNKESTVF